MKIFYTLIVCLLCTLSAYSQGPNDGKYLFQDAEFTILNYTTRANINTTVVNNAALLDSTDAFFQRAFLELDISNGVLASCILPNQVEYTVVNDLLLVPSKIYDSNLVYDPNGPESLDGRKLYPYTLLFSGNTLTLTVIFIYGNTGYNFTLEGQLVVTLNKQI